MSELFAPAATATGTTMSAFSGMVPNYATVRKVDPTDSSAVSDIRAAMGASVVLSLSVGIVLAGVLKSKVPFLTSLATSVILVVLFEHALRAHPGKPVPKESN